MGPATLSVVYICPTEFYSWNGKVCMALLKALQKRSYCIYHQHQRSWKPLKRSVFMKSALIIRSNLQRNRVKCHGSYKRFQNLRWILKQLCLYCSLIGDNKKKKNLFCQNDLKKRLYHYHMQLRRPFSSTWDLRLNHVWRGDSILPEKKDAYWWSITKKKFHFARGIINYEASE